MEVAEVEAEVAEGWAWGHHAVMIGVMAAVSKKTIPCAKNFGLQNYWYALLKC